MAPSPFDLFFLSLTVQVAKHNVFCTEPLLEKEKRSKVEAMKLIN